MPLSDDPFYIACRDNDSATLALLLNKPYYDFNLSEGLWGACIGGHRNLVDLMIEKGAFIHCGLQGACEGGHRALVDLLIKKGAYIWDWGLQGACRGGHRDLVDLMIEKGANDWDRGLESACLGGHRDLVDLMIEKGAKYWDFGLGGAFEGGHRDLVNLMLEKGANKLYVGSYGFEKQNIARLILCLGKQKSGDFIDYLQYEDFYEDYTIRDYLTNRHLIRCESSQPLQIKKRTLRNVLVRFVHTDVATFSYRFVGWCVND